MRQLSHVESLSRRATAASMLTSTLLVAKSPTIVTMVTTLTLVFQWRQCVWRMAAGVMLPHPPDVYVSIFLTKGHSRVWVDIKEKRNLNSRSTYWLFLELFTACCSVPRWMEGDGQFSCLPCCLHDNSANLIGWGWPWEAVESSGKASKWISSYCSPQNFDNFNNFYFHSCICTMFLCAGVGYEKQKRNKSWCREKEKKLWSNHK